jgi:hypothetical protein
VYLSPVEVPHPVRQEANTKALPSSDEQESPFYTLHIYHDGENYHAAFKTDRNKSNTSAQKGYRQRLFCAWLTAGVTAIPTNNDEI